MSQCYKYKIKGLEVQYRRSKRLHGSTKGDTKWDDTETIALDGMNMYHYIQGTAEDDDFFENERTVLLDIKENGCDLASCGALRFVLICNDYCFRIWIISVVQNWTLQIPPR